MLGEPTALGGIFFMFILPGFIGAIIGMVITAIGTVAMTPTRASFITNLLLGGGGYIVGFFIGMVRAQQLPRDLGVIAGTAVFGAVLAGGTREGCALGEKTTLNHGDWMVPNAPPPAAHQRRVGEPLLLSSEATPPRNICHVQRGRIRSRYRSEMGRRLSKIPWFKVTFAFSHQAVIHP
jgi:hypothetical protein